MDTDVGLENEYLGITEAAEYLRVSASTLRRWEKKGFLVPERTPTGIRRYTKKQLDDVIQAPPTVDHMQTASTEHKYADTPSIVETIHPSTKLPTGNQDSISNNGWTDLPEQEPADVESVVQIEAQTSDEIEELRSFFKKAGYDSPTEDLVQTADQPTIVRRPDQIHKAAEVTEQHTPDSIHAYQASSVETNIAQSEPTQNTPQIESFWRQVHAPTQERIDVFHEEHSTLQETQVQNQFHSDGHLSFRTDEVDQTGSEVERIAQDRSESDEARRPRSGAWFKFLAIGLAVCLVAFVVWAAYSYYSAPVELYSAVIE